MFIDIIILNFVIYTLGKVVFYDQTQELNE